ncbi:hypothetical protein JCGZ_10965 [Jatropha curcas]|uniref:B box-type domain-containing protein n=1 Tax=Jatropha curcas TaxID=180498 RepID=A0A067LDU4_JATCU|nr:hypothetical protein JCGZ_10965 [Jatropha curcas]
MGKYLFYHGGGGDDHMEFGVTDIGDNRVGEQIFTNLDGSILVKHDSNGKFWRATPNWIYPITTDASNSDPAVHICNKLASRHVRVGLANPNDVPCCDICENAPAFFYCEVDGNSLCLQCDLSVHVGESLVLEELVKVKQIYNMEYLLDDATVYDESILKLARSCVSNSTQQTQKIEVKMSYTEAWKYEWTTSTSTSASISMKVSLGIPKIMDSSIEVNEKWEKEYEWGTTINGSLQLTKTIPVSVSPMTKMTVSLLATLGSCNVPFSYTQQDTLTDGNLNVSVKHDGVYSGVNCFKFRTETSEEKL